MDILLPFGVFCTMHLTIQASASAAYVIYTPTGQVFSSGGVCLWPSSNNVAEYRAVIELLRNAISHGVHSLEVHLDS